MGKPLRLRMHSAVLLLALICLGSPLFLIVPEPPANNDYRVLTTSDHQHTVIRGALKLPGQR